MARICDTVNITQSTWANYRELLVLKNPNWQHEEHADEYFLFFEDGAAVYDYTLKKSDPPGVDQIEWETVYQPQSNFAIGSRQYAFASGDFDFAGDAVFNTCAPGSTKDIDYVLAEDLYINGGTIMLDGSVIGDWVNVDVIHPVLGVVKTFIKKRYVPAAPVGISTPMMSVNTAYAAKIQAGLTVRLTYHSTGIVPVKIGVNYDLHRAI